MHESNMTAAISNSSNSTNQTAIYGYTEMIDEDFNFDEFGTPLISNRTYQILSAFNQTQSPRKWYTGYKGRLH